MLLILLLMFLLMAFLSIFNLIFSESSVSEISYVALVICLTSIIFTILGKLFQSKPKNSHQTKWITQGATLGAVAGAIILSFFNIDIPSPFLNYLCACVAGLFLSALIEAFRVKIKNV